MQRPLTSTLFPYTTLFRSNHVLGELFGITITGWKLVGYLGVFLFAGRWFVQVIATHARGRPVIPRTDRKSTRLNSSHVKNSYAVFCLKKKTIKNDTITVNK